MATMTKRDFFTAIVTGSVVTADLEAFAKGEIAKLDRANESKRVHTSSSKAEANAPLKAHAEAILLSAKEPLLGTTIAKMVGVSASKITPILKSIEGIVVTEVSVPKVGKRKAYALPHEAEAEVSAEETNA